MRDSNESTNRPKKYTLKEKLRQVRRDLAKSLRMDRPTDPQMELDTVSSMEILPSPFGPDSEGPDSEGSDHYGPDHYGPDSEGSLYANNDSPPYYPTSPFVHPTSPPYRPATPPYRPSLSPLHYPGTDESLSDTEMPDEEYPATSDEQHTTMADQQQFDGSGGMFARYSRAPTPIAAIFIHAGAGYHSTTNEQYHLGACSDACKMAMRILKSGGSAVDAVEAAVRVLEDREITNAGYGSNLSIMGRVEGDATVVDHLGRSGACGATPQIKNPISLARLVLELSNRPLSLRRVPPNLLVGTGATEFAREHGITVVPHEAIISKSALERYTRWKDDLRRAELQRPTVQHSSTKSQISEEEDDEGNSRRDHTNAILTGTWNEGQPDSPAPASPAPPRYSPNFLSNPSPDQEEFNTSNTPPNLPSPLQISTPSLHANCKSPASIASSTIHYGQSPPKRSKHGHAGREAPPRNQSPLNQQMDYTRGRRTPNNSDGPNSPVRYQSIGNSQMSQIKVDPFNLDGEREDRITDTVGAIAIDSFGNIAAASSSGGIGMKHSGRVGPAALVGIGSAVIPVDDRDPDAITVAAVTSGTGEHMATTVASQKCCERLYNCSRKGPGPRGGDVECTEEQAIESFVTWDFMEHPGVRVSHSQGAIGVMAVKKTPNGYYLHFAHNTDSFALASMHSNEGSPKCVMSRLGNEKNVVQGGRKIRAD